jgi:predicted tellurium resistance membrane protein TerC
MIELADFAFALDSVLIAVALSEHLWVIYTGAAIGIAAMRFAAGFVLTLIARFPQIEVAAYILVGWTATKLLLSALGESTLLRSTDTVPESLMPQWLFWLGVILIITAGTFLAYRGRPPRQVGPQVRGRFHRRAAVIRTNRMSEVHRLIGWVESSNQSSAGTSMLSRDPA